MKRRFGRILTGMMILVLLAVSISGVFAQDDEAQVRFVHAIPGASDIDVYTDGQLTITGLELGTASTYVRLPVGEHELTVTVSGSTVPLWEQTINLASGSVTTLVAASPSQASFQVYSDDLSPLPLGRARLTAIHAIAAGADVDLILTDGRPVIPELSAGTPAGTLDVPVFTYDFAVVPTGGEEADALLSPVTLSLGTGTSYMLVVYGSEDNPSSLVLTAPTTSAAESGLVRVVHGVAGAPAVDIYLNDTLAIPSLAFGEGTEHIAVPVGEYEVAIRGAGSDADLFTSSISVETGQALTVAALGTANSVNAEVLADNIDGVEAHRARVTLINGIPGENSLSAILADGTEIGTEIGFGEAGAATDIEPSHQAINLSVATDSGENSVQIPAQMFYGGVYYNLVAVDDNGTIRILIEPTSLAQGAASAPSTGDSRVVSQPEVAVEPTVPAISEPEIAVQPTEVPTIAPQPTVAPEGPTGRVFNLNPDANLQLRQYPNTGALSLGTVPPGTILIVNGREGGIEPIPLSATPTAPDDYEFIDPVTLLDDPERDDLVPEETWLFITYNTPDGGSINAWGNGLYIDVRNPRGERMRLAELPTVAGNTPGEAVNTVVTPPPVPADRVAVIVFNLDAGVNLNIRRLPQTSGEVLARVPNATVMEFRGINEAREWVFVSYAPPEGGSVTGWVDADYVRYSFNNRSIDLTEMETRNLLTITPGTERGAIAAGVPQAAIPTANPIRDAIVAEVALDSGSNLNLRRNPNINSEVLIQLPSGTRVVVNGRSEDELWLNVSFESLDGWIAAQTETAVFVRLTRNGQTVPLSEVPLFTGEVITGTSATATPEENLEDLAAVVTDAVIAMTGSPGGDSQGLPILSRGQNVTRLFTDGVFSYIELPDGTRGWVPAGAIALR